MINNFSPNMLKTYQTCPKKFYYKYIEKLSVPISAQPFEKGKKIHALANYFLQGINISRIETALNETERNVWNLLLDNKFFKMDCYKSEYTLSCKVEDYWIGGRLDAVVRDFDKYYILDYKTGFISKNPKYDFQTMVYLLCLDRLLKNYEALAFVYINLKENNNYVIEFDEELKAEYEKLIIKQCEKISTDNIYTCCPNSCQRCEYSRFCN